jgi:hypothetical protein
LGAGLSAVDLVGQNDLGEYGAWSELKFATIPPKDVSAHNVRRKEIGRELDAFKESPKALANDRAARVLASPG